MNVLNLNSMLFIIIRRIRNTKNDSEQRRSIVFSISFYIIVVYVIYFTIGTD